MDKLRAVGYSEVIFKSDQEPAILALKAAVAKEWQGNITMDPSAVRNEESPVGEHESNGAVENAVRRIQGQVRTLRNALESRYRVHIDRNSNVVPWMISHAAATIT